ncbi:hypothetical protein RMATCC62417_03910 [Rhizopus microsporus]|nr:hypothetical protein RMATCC62417_03910 [Rhizopus microsporus]
MQKRIEAIIKHQEYEGKLNAKHVFVKEIPLEDFDNDWEKNIDILEDLSDEYIHKPCTTLVYNDKALVVANHSERNSLCNFLKLENPNFLERLKLVETIISGLIYLHCHNLVHCNLTSSCIILDENNTPKFRGAGLIRVGADHAANNSVSEDAVRWMAPELLTGSPPSFKSDIFSLGVILWEILVDGDYPYKELVDNASISKMVLMGYRNLFPKDVLPSYRKLVENCWKNDPDDRPESVELISIMHLVMCDMKKQLGKVEEPDMSSAVKHFGKLNHKDPVNNIFDVAKYCYKMGKYRKAMAWYEMAAEKGNANAVYEIAQMFMYGITVKQDYDEAKKRYEAAANMGSTDAICAIGLMYAYGRGVVPSKQKAIKYFQQAADMGSAVALYNMALIYKTGEDDEEYSIVKEGDDVKKDNQKALEYLNKASEMGLPNAVGLIGVMHSSGRGIEHSNAKAMNCFQKAARGGCIWSMYHLGQRYYKGTFVYQDYEEAMTWYKKAIDKCQSDALCKIDGVYKVAVDLEEPYHMALKKYDEVKKKVNHDP